MYTVLYKQTIGNNGKYSTFQKLLEWEISYFYPITCTCTHVKTVLVCF